MRRSAHIPAQRAPAPQSRRSLVTWCNEHAGLTAILALLVAMLTLGFMVWQQFRDTSPPLTCPPGAKVCANTITNNFYGPTEFQAGSGGQQTLGSRASVKEPK